MSGSDLRALSNLLSQSEDGGTRGASNVPSAAGAAIRTPGDFGAPKKLKGKASEAKKSGKGDDKDIWNEEEVDTHDVDFDDDGRIKPEYEINVGQNVFSQDRKFLSEAACCCCCCRCC